MPSNTGITLLIIIFFVFILKKYYVALHRQIYIRSFTLPDGLIDRIKAEHPGLSGRDLELMHLALRHFFAAYLKGGFKPIMMPSMLVGVLWCEFSRYSKSYQRFCEKAFGHVLPYKPVGILSDNKEANAALRRCWQYACHEEGINPYVPNALPLLFEIDSLCNTENGVFYLVGSPPLEKRPESVGKVFYTSDFLSSAFDGSLDGLDDLVGKNIPISVDSLA